MHIGSIPNYSATSATSNRLSAPEVRKTDNAFKALFADASPEETLKKITEGGVEGMLKWKIDEMKKKASEESLAARGLTLEDVAAMPPAARIALENQIMDEVAQKLKEAMNQQMQRERGVGGLDTYDPSRLAENENQSIDFFV